MKKLFVGNLDFGATESSVRSLFEPYGAIESVNLVTDRETGRSRGFAFVEMTDSAQADEAIRALNGANVDGRALNVNEARPKTDGGGFSRGGGYSRGGGGGNSRGGGYSRGGGGNQRSRW
jgi:RNA recognition motif-containing protein